ncbi:uncharacterized protein PGTG_08931 [Puccinia graminis f. sp. tritici CRL 75-36-700-3]|uniref:Myb/SANT-like domain-containing protein n=1 Tax=Puccinia graminis f. sp. tritici (strain CRL 75-36-700-3 / race SCCL) TaxID=418459 RepID=E3KEM1_PUCGT|nr:uncharacterized protein PGTG_08931 [Puccinia graminis f. sp. tritici CRL 75-36-700-3]EFP82735.2 hypothetical protein PGTG_08931 [Puccinia graminis f. sp. tritici CRL 75-36-700-3]
MSSQMERGYHSWSDEQKVKLLESIIEQIDKGRAFRNIADGNLNIQGWTAVRKQLNNSFDLDLTDRQIKHQKGSIQTAFFDYQFLRGQQGFGWDDETHTLTADQKTWNQLTRINPRNSLAKLKNKPFKIYHLADRIFNPRKIAQSPIKQDDTVVKREEVNPKKRTSSSIHNDEDSDIEILDSRPEQAPTPAKRPREGESLASRTPNTRSKERDPPSGSDTSLKDPSTKPSESREDQMMLDAMYKAFEEDDFTPTPNGTSGTRSQKEGGPAHASTPLKELPAARPQEGDSSSNVTKRTDQLTGPINETTEKEKSLASRDPSIRSQKDDDGPFHSSTTPMDSPTVCPREAETSAAAESLSDVAKSTNQSIRPINSTTEQEKSPSCGISSTRSQQEDGPVHSLTPPKDPPMVCPREGGTSAVVNPMSNVTKSTDQLIGPINSVTEGEKSLACGIPSTQSQKEDGPVHSSTPPKDPPMVCPREGEMSAVVNPMSHVTKSTDQLIGPINRVTEEEKTLPCGISSTRSQKEDGPATPPKDSHTICPGKGETPAVSANCTKQFKRSDSKGATEEDRSLLNRILGCQSRKEEEDPTDSMAPLLQHSISTKALKSLAELFMNEIDENDYIRFVRVLENEKKATTFLALVHTSSKRICNLWLDLEAPGL